MSGPGVGMVQPTGMEGEMSTDLLDRGRLEDETEEMRLKREKNLEGTPPPEFFKLRAPLLAEGRSDQKITSTDTMQVRLKVYASGGENALHNHTDQDHFHLVLQGRGTFFGPRGEEREVGQYEGVMLPKGCFYRFLSSGDEPLVLLRVGCKVPGEKNRLNVYGDPLPANSAENGKIAPVLKEGAFWGAAE
jgi:mannose-6-phosphate isomerase-like protein (cupin superfamily)